MTQQEVWILTYTDDKYPDPLIYIYATEELANTGAKELQTNADSNGAYATIDVIKYLVLDKPGLPRY